VCVCDQVDASLRMAPPDRRDQDEDSRVRWSLFHLEFLIATHTSTTPKLQSSGSATEASDDNGMLDTLFFGGQQASRGYCDVVVCWVSLPWNRCGHGIKSCHISITITIRSSHVVAVIYTICSERNGNRTTETYIQFAYGRIRSATPTSLWHDTSILYPITDGYIMATAHHCQSWYFSFCFLFLVLTCCCCGLVGPCGTVEIWWRSNSTWMWSA